MDNKPIESEWTPLSIVVAILAALMILFSFFAPVLLTQLPSTLNFSETGSIGDTIGGLMNPFVALGGVLLTFLAFYIQVKANKQQREHFEKSLGKSFLDEKKDCHYKLNLLMLDLEHIRIDLENRMGEIKKYIEAESSNPYFFYPLRRNPHKMYQRLGELDRMSIYKGFKFFCSGNDGWLSVYNTLFKLCDYLSEAIPMMYSRVDYHMNDVYAVKKEICTMLTDLEQTSVFLIKDNVDNNRNIVSNDIINKMIREYRNRLSEAEETDLLKVKVILDDFVKAVNDFFVYEKNYYYELNNLIALSSRIIMKMTSIESNSSQIISMLDSMVKIIEVGEKKSTYTELGEVIKVIKDALEMYPIESLTYEKTVS